MKGFLFLIGSGNGCSSAGQPDVSDFNAGGVWSDFLFHDPAPALTEALPKEHKS